MHELHPIQQVFMMGVESQYIIYHLQTSITFFNPADLFPATATVGEEVAISILNMLSLDAQIPFSLLVPLNVLKLSDYLLIQRMQTF